MSGRVCTIVACGIVVLAWAAPAVVHAQLRVTDVEGRPWFDVVSDLAESLDSEGALVSLCVRQGSGACTPCGGYALSFDDDGPKAFEVGACDPATGATAVQLVDRSALFDHDHAVPVPRAIAVRASLARGSSTERVTPRAAGTGVACSVRIRPYVRDLEHGVIVPLEPDAYDVRVARLHADVAPSADGSFVLSSTDEAATELSYDVIERASGTVVLVGRATLSCSAAADVPATLPDAVAPVPAQHGDALALAGPTPPPSVSGIRIAPRDPGRDGAQTVAIAGASLASASLITLIGIGIGTLVHTSPSCTEHAPVLGAGATSASGAPSVRCVAWSGPHPSETPAELTWTVVGTLGLGLVLGIAGALELALAPEPDAPRLYATAGLAGGSLGLSGSF